MNTTTEAAESQPKPMGYQFRLRTFMIGQAILTVFLALIVASPAAFPAGLVYAGLFTSVFFGARALARYRPRVSRFALAALYLGDCAELYAAHLAYHTIGEIVAGGFYVMIILNIPAVLMPAFGLRWLPAVLALAFALFLVPEQLELREKWSRCDEEAHAIIAYVEAFKTRTGVYPTDLSGYRFRRPELIPDFRYDLDPALLYQIRYNIGSENTSHDYSPARGWFYYPD